MTSTSSSGPLGTLLSHATSERAAELAENLADIRERIQNASRSAVAQQRTPLLVAVSKYKPASDVLACYEQGQRDFGENYVQELVDKAKELPQDIRWHFIGTLQTNKSKILAALPNLHALQTLASIKAADALNRALPAERELTPLNVLLQVNTSGEDVKSGLPPLMDSVPESSARVEGESALLGLAVHVLENCPRLRLQGLMTIGSLSESLSAVEENRDFDILVRTCDRLEEQLRRRYLNGVKWDDSRKLLLSMGMSSDFEAALKSGSDIVRVGTGIFGQRHVKGEK